MSAIEDLWLAQNTINCSPYDARISRAMCASNQENRDRIHCPCPAAVTNAQPMPERKEKRKTAGLGYWLDTGIRLEVAATETKLKPSNPVPSQKPATTPRTPAETLENSCRGGVELSKPKSTRRRSRQAQPQIAAPALTTEESNAMENEIRRLARFGHPAAQVILALLTMKGA